MLYRAHRDIHLQLPADEMSVSLNIVETSHSSVFRDQYRFDVETSKIDGDHDPDVAGADAGARRPLSAARRAMDLLADFAAAHPSDRIRWCALRARAAAAPTLDERIAMFEEGDAHGQPAGQRHGAARDRPARGRPRLDRRRAAARRRLKTGLRDCSAGLLRARGLMRERPRLTAIASEPWASRRQARSATCIWWAVLEGSRP